MRHDDPRCPLQWPEGWKRTPASQRRRGRFTRRDTGVNGWRSSRALTFAEALRRLLEQVRLLGADRPVLSTNVELRLDGLPRASDARKLDDPGAALYFTLRGQARCLACDGYLDVASNIAALAGHIEALRAIDRYGVGTIDQAFAGYAPRLQAAPSEWWTVLGVPRTAAWERVEAAYREAAKVAHPDAGGSPYQMARLTEAMAAARAEIGRP